MYAGRKASLGKPKDDPEWIKEIAFQVSILKKRKVTDEDKKLFRELFFEYQRDGLSPKDAIEKAKNIVLSFGK
jgi:hypothetical protein